MIDADHIVRGEGISWMRRYLGEDEHAPIRHPAIVSGLETRIMGIRLPNRKGGTAATIIPSVGCPMGCNFCTTSAFFGGKGKFVNFYETGDELFEVMCGIESELKVHSFFVMDENFLLHRTRAMQLLERMKEAGKSWELSIFASANAIRKYTMLELVELGVSWVWMGLESPRSNYSKLQGERCHQLTRNFANTGYECRARPSSDSSITRPTTSRKRSNRRSLPDRLPPVHALHPGAGHAALPGDGRARASADRHRLRRHSRAVQIQFPHAAISRDDSKRFLDWAFWRDFEKNGPSLYRMCQTMLRAGSVTRTIPIRACASALRGR
jgi:hypothetical protein